MASSISITTTSDNQIFFKSYLCKKNNKTRKKISANVCNLFNKFYKKKYPYFIVNVVNLDYWDEGKLDPLVASLNYY
jgi:hypothetical protein